MKILSIDIETFSSADLKKCGVHRYCESTDFEILLFGYAVDDEPVRVIDLASGGLLPDAIRAAILDSEVTKSAWNASFERTCLSRYLGARLDPASWRCTMVWAATLGLPLSLEQAGAVLGLEQQKLKEGRELIRYFCQPCKPTLTNGGRQRNLPIHSPEKWVQFMAYNMRDVEVERAIQQRLSKYPVPEVERQNYVLDQQINDRGIQLDMELVHLAIRCDEQFRLRHLSTARALTGLENPNSTQQLKTWLERNGLTVESLSKAAVADLLSEAEGISKQVLLLRRELAKSSVKKYTAMRNAVCHDGRARGLLQFYGANRTGRHSSKLIQCQNLPSNHLPDLEQARNLVRDGQFDAIEPLYDSVPMVLSELIRTAFVPKPGCRFLVADFSAIEARVIAWLAGERWRLDVFNSHGKIYEASAAQMFHVPIEQITKGSPLRQKGKIAELACIAEHSLVLTHTGLVPIEQVTTDHLLWDGVEWVRHDGVVYKGEREVICYDGLAATPDHLVYVEGQEAPEKLQDARANLAKLIRVGAYGTAWLCGIMPVYDILNAGPRHQFTVSGRLVHNCGYGGGVGALTKMGALAMGVKEDELQGLIRDWRSANPAIVRLWWDLDAAAMEAVRERTTTQAHGIRITYESGMLFIQLPSGRRLAYVKPRIGKNKFDRDGLTYEGVGGAKKWQRIETYGPKLVENLVQGTARDLLTDAMRRIDAAGYKIVMHVHDELIVEATPDQSLDKLCALMAEQPEWAKGLPLRADGYECTFYKKE